MFNLIYQYRVIRVFAIVLKLLCFFRFFYYWIFMILSYWPKHWNSVFQRYHHCALLFHCSLFSVFDWNSDHLQKLYGPVVARQLLERLSKSYVLLLLTCWTLPLFSVISTLPLFCLCHFSLSFQLSHFLYF